MNKIKSVINSCETLEQLDVAIKWINLYIDKCVIPEHQNFNVSVTKGLLGKNEHKVEWRE